MESVQGNSGRSSRSSAKAPPRFDCEACGIYRTPIHSPKMDYSGNGSKQILVVGEGPGEVEDRLGKQWQGPVGRILQDAAKKAGIDLFRDCWTTNSVNCRPTEPAKSKDLKNRTPTSFEISCCRQVKVLPAIEELKPKLIIVAGYPALQSIVGHSFGVEDLDPISKWTGSVIPDRVFNSWICPVFHPSFIARNKDYAVRTIWERDLRRAFAMWDKSVPHFEDEEKSVRILTQEGDVESVLRKLLDEAAELVFDYETTGLKPYNTDEHKIVSCALGSLTGEEVYSFLQPKSERCLLLLEKLLRHPRIGKIAWNMKFEHVWSKLKMGVEVRPWSWDPMQFTHLEDNRTGICGLDIQAYMKFGRQPWDREVKEWKESKDKKNKNSANRLLEFASMSSENLRKLLLYGGIDVQLTKMLALSQRRRKRSLLHDLVHDACIAFADAEMAGMRVDTEKGREQHKFLSKKIDYLEKKVQEGEVFQELQKKYGSKANIGSSDQLSEILFNVLGHKPSRLTPKKQRGATDDESLERLDLPDLNNLLTAKKFRKIRDTYLEGFIRETGVDGFMHPFFSLHTTVSGRSSAEAPNLQNVPIRDELAQRICRGILYARKGHCILEPDYSGIEVRVAACICKDPNLIRYVTDSTTDMHRDMALEIFKWKGDFDYKKHNALKHLRYAAKNGFVFPSFYGSYYEQTAEGLATHIQMPQSGKWYADQGIDLPDGGLIGEHMIQQGIKSYEDFVDHLKAVEHDFWYKRFRVYTQWKEQWWEKYQRNGYCETPTGFPSVDVLSRNECLNRPIQGAAFHCLLWLYVHLWREQKARKWVSRMMGQIHDSILWDAAKSEVKEIVETIRTLVKQLQSEWKWIIVPLDVEFEVTDVDRPWSEKRAYDGSF